MPKGGARTRSGPAPDPNALARAHDKGEWIDLPAEGREGEPPEWPLSKPLKREGELWETMWRKPQAVMWEAQGQEFEVAIYVRRLCEAEKRGSAVNLSTLVRQMSDSLGLTTPGLRSNRWRIVRTGTTETKRGEEPASSDDVRAMLTIVQGAG